MSYDLTVSRGVSERNQRGYYIPGGANNSFLVSPSSGAVARPSGSGAGWFQQQIGVR